MADGVILRRLGGFRLGFVFCGVGLGGLEGIGFHRRKVLLGVWEAWRSSGFRVR